VFFVVLLMMINRWVVLFERKKEKCLTCKSENGMRGMQIILLSN
jgi:hypothetical protein